MKVLTFSTLFPNTERPHHGIFTETALKQINQTGHVESVVVAPVPWFLFKNARFGKYAAFARIPKEEVRIGTRVLHPRYLLPPKVGMHMAPFSIAASCLRTLEDLIDGGFDFDVIDAHYFYPDGVAAALLGKYFKKPVVISALGTDINLIPQFPLARKMILWAAENAFSLVSVCEALKTEMVKIGVAEPKIQALRNGVDLALFRPVDRQATRQRLGIAGFTAISVGHLDPRKGHDHIISALPHVPDVNLLIVGNGPDEKKLKALAVVEGVNDRVRFLGALPQERLREYYGACDALVLASSREGWANVLLESMACGTPVVASNVWGTPEVVRDKACGVLMPSLSPLGVVRGIEALRRNYPDRGATRAYAQGFSWGETAQRKVELFRKAVQVDGRPAQS
ncbi:glycosyltransferase family 4 protein [Hydrogenophaga sp. BPS33]|uniref:glycosyltransferase family 4 protein n=1 Tax=Hydrogenophaga sp. BPS33 TaxID=2651974 RepID=UPI00131F7240|nr:glycosyltransferase family 4 protein [Hydrogenophaga sp. BPS33]QHE84881.1 glycosyltransferase family 4 protein [Hydrogenophaga sp. BPS33]